VGRALIWIGGRRRGGCQLATGQKAEH
jgi:hypothetical protein